MFSYLIEKIHRENTLNRNTLHGLAATQGFANVKITERFPREIFRLGLIETVLKELDAFEAELQEIRAQKQTEQPDLEHHIEDVRQPTNGHATEMQ